jgi:hypothetical protein
MNRGLMNALLGRLILQSLEAFKRKRRSRDRPDGQGHQRELVIVGGNAIGADETALSAAMDDRPFAVISNGNCDRFHHAPTAREPITDFHIDVQATQAKGTMVAMVRAVDDAGDYPAAIFAHERLIRMLTIRGFVISFQWKLLCEFVVF